MEKGWKLCSTEDFARLCHSRPLDYSHSVVQSSLAHCRKGKRTIVAGSMGLDRPNNVNTICLQGPLSEKTRKKGRLQPNIGLYFSSGYQERDGRRWSSSERAVSLWSGLVCIQCMRAGQAGGRGGAPREAGSWSWPGSSLGCCLVVCLSRLSALHTSTPPRSVQRLGHHRHTIASVLGALHCTDKRQNNERGRTVLSSGLCNALPCTEHKHIPPPSIQLSRVARTLS